MLKPQHLLTLMALHLSDNSNPLLATMLDCLRRALPADEPYLHPAG